MTYAEDISERLWKQQQSWHYERVLSVDSARFRVTIRRNAHDFQSWARVCLWNGSKWERVVNCPIERLECRRFSYVLRSADIDVFRKDGDSLLDEAIAITAPSEAEQVHV
jgi:hypothetical protein